MPIPLYSCDFAFLNFINQRRALRLERAGLAKAVRHKGHLNRVVFYRRPGDPPPTTIRMNPERPEYSTQIAMSCLAYSMAPLIPRRTADPHCALGT